jgi:hypothetical protein
MKTKFLMVAWMSWLTFTTAAAAPQQKDGVEIRITDKASPEDAQRAREMQVRLDEIQALDYNHLSHDEKVALRKEIREMKKEAREMDGVYFYFGGGFLLLLIIILIIVL